jgi:hypothetical protein
MGLAAWPLSACALLLGSDLRPVASSVEKPSNVAFYVAVDNGEEPVTDLLADNFSIYENDQLIPKEQAQLTLLDGDVAAAHHAVLLVDVSASNDSDRLGKAIAAFVTKVHPLEGVTVLAFDGSTELQSIAHVPKEGEAAALAEYGLGDLRARDPSRNLYGAILNGLDELDARLMQIKKPVRVGVLVVFSSGPDLAGRATEDAIHDKLDSSDHDLVTIAVGDDPGWPADGLASGGTIRAQAASTLPIAFEEAATLVARRRRSHYLVSYCSPSRAGVRRARLEAHYTTREGEQRGGEFELDFDASGFGPGCDPTAPPSFAVHAVPPGETPRSAGSSAASPPASTEALPADGAPASGPKRKAPGKSQPAEGEETIVPPPDRPGYE